MVKINKSLTVLLLSVMVAGSALMTSCDDWLDVKSSGEVLEKDAFTEVDGFRSTLMGVYKMASSPNLWGQDLTWGFLSTLSWNYTAGNAIPEYRTIIQKFNWDNSQILAVCNRIWSTAYTAIANVNNVIQNLEQTNLTFEYPWEKDMIMAEARGLRALLHFELLQLYAPAPITGFNGTAIPYVTTYPDLQPVHLSFDEVIKHVLDDLKYAQETLEPIDVELRETSHFIAGATRMDNMDYVLFQGVGNIKSDGGKRDNSTGDGFFAFRGFRLNYWGATALLARVYSYMRDFSNAEKYADEVMSWVRQYQFNLYSANPSSATNPNKIDMKRRPEPLMALYDAQLPTRYATALGTTYNKMIGSSTSASSNKFKNLFDDPTTDVRYLDLFNTTSLQYRGWTPESAYAADNTITKYSYPLIPVIELPEIYFIKAECQARNGNIPGALATIKAIRDARGCITVLNASNLDEFMNLLVMEAQRDFLTRGTTYTFLKKLDWQSIFDSSATGFEPYKKYTGETGSYYVLPIPDSETKYY